MDNRVSDMKTFDYTFAYYKPKPTSVTSLQDLAEEVKKARDAMLASLAENGCRVVKHFYYASKRYTPSENTVL